MCSHAGPLIQDTERTWFLVLEDQRKISLSLLQLRLGFRLYCNKVLGVLKMFHLVRELAL